MPTATINKTYSLPGYTSLQTTINRVGQSALPVGGSDAPITLNAAKAVTDWVKTDANTAACNLAAGHGQTNGKYDVFWTAAGVNYRRYGVDGTIATNALSLDGGAGDDFPASATTGVVVCKPVTVSVLIDGDAVTVMWAALLFANVSATGRGHVAFQESDGSAVGAINISGIQQGTAVVDYDIEGGATNPITGDPVGLAQVSHNDTVYTPTFQMCVLIGDATP
jgi:hypothetical protein